MKEESSWLEKLLQTFDREPQDRDQLLHVLRDAEQRNVISIDALAMIEGALQVANLQVRDIMIPRTQAVVIHQDDSLKKIVHLVTGATHSRYPIIGDERNEVIGILHGKDLLRFAFMMHDEDFDLRDILRPVVYVPESKSLDILLKEFRLTRNHMAVVVDEYGVMSGLVTIEDVIEQIVGEIEDEFDVDDDSFIKKHDDHEFIVKAVTPIDEFNEYFKVAFNHDEFDTIGGLVLQAFGQMPQRGDKTTLDNFAIEILHADKRRIRLLKIYKD